MANVFGILTAIVLAIAAFVAFKNKNAYEAEITNRQSEEGRLKVSQDRLKLAQDNLSSTNEQQSETEADIAQLQTQEAAQKKANSETEDAIATKKAEVAANKTKLDEIAEKAAQVGDVRELASKMKIYRGEIEDLGQSISAAEARLANLTADNNRVEAVINDLRSEGERISRGESAPGLRTRISSIYQNWGFVTLAAGNSAGVVANSTLDVVRDGEVIAKLLVTAVESSTSSANIIPDTLKEETVLMVGDQVVPGRKAAPQAAN